MSDFEPVDLQRMPDYTRFEDASGLEYEVYGGESRLSVAFEIARKLDRRCQTCGGIDSLIHQV
ncbi:hypothetical protein LF1_57350 [Rubripirellula obstinata]|uniref:Uncharacterized protein n=1 Tax=Rubripirellula obstinata TaxID=406547 RepID=A0A5B1CBG6_9BACT|nr:hypothetical protein [Rubripirellula obstinata]KAA1256989.1 hypothetical protein LF1_57350 [Rubripirellula obstinata]